jgi:predicted lipoprotein with Yx(FWY)xxD motif
MKPSQRNAISTATAVAVIVVILVVAVGAAYFVLIPSKSTSTSSTGTSSTTTATTSSTTTSSSEAYTVQIGDSATIGHYLENGTGFTLYMFGSDKPGNGTSNCTGTCAVLWPPFYASTLNLPSNLNESSFSTITRTDGSKQTTYNGWPLYYYATDKSAGSMLGEGIDQLGGLWYAIPPTLQQSGGQIIGGTPYSVGVAYAPSVGLYLTNSSGFTLYFRSTDTPNSGTTTCTTDRCEESWPVFYQASLNLPIEFSSSQFSTITAYNTTKITTFNGYPLFYWVGDTKAGSTTGEGIGGFYVATLPILTVPSTTTTTTSTSTTTTSSSSSYNPGY